jgi:hypothetical protein
MSKSYLQFVCPLSGKRARSPLVEEEDGVFLPVDEDEEGGPLPIGWGRVTVEVLIRNPEIAVALENRRQMVEEMNAEVMAQIRNPNNPRAADIQAEIDSGSAAEQIQAAAEERFPPPERDTVLMRATYSALSDEALAAVLEVLNKVGLRFTGLEGA